MRFGILLKRAGLRVRFPDLSDEGIDNLLLGWLRRE